jgi:hypothetical protein
MDDTTATTAGDAVADLRSQMSRVRLLHERRAADPTLRERLATLARWQAARLRQTYADLEAQPRYRAAMEFFLDDLYGPTDFSRRDADLERIAPMLAAMLPARVIQTVSCAVEVNALTTELDVDLLQRMGPPDADGRLVTVARYCDAYRQSGKRAERRRQIELIVIVGRALERYVRMPLIHSALRMMRLPARLSGFADMHDFLERGFSAFEGLGNANEFLATVESRESSLLEKIFSGDRRPFPEPPLG